MLETLYNLWDWDQMDWNWDQLNLHWSHFKAWSELNIIIPFTNYIANPFSDLVVYLIDKFDPACIVMDKYFFLPVGRVLRSFIHKMNWFYYDSTDLVVELPSMGCSIWVSFLVLCRLSGIIAPRPPRGTVGYHDYNIRLAQLKIKTSEETLQSYRDDDMEDFYYEDIIWINEKITNWKREIYEEELAMQEIIEREELEKKKKEAESTEQQEGKTGDEHVDDGEVTNSQSENEQTSNNIQPVDKEESEGEQKVDEESSDFDYPYFEIVEEYKPKSENKLEDESEVESEGERRPYGPEEFKGGTDQSKDSVSNSR